MNTKVLSQMSKQQQIIHTAMFMDTQMMPSFHPSSETINLGLEIKKLFEAGVLSHMSLDENGCIRCY